MLPIIKEIIEENKDLIEQNKFHELFDLFDDMVPLGLLVPKGLFNTLSSAGIDLSEFRKQRLKMICDYIVNLALKVGDGESLHHALSISEKNWTLFIVPEIHDYIVDNVEKYNITIKDYDPTHYKAENFRIWRKR